MGKNNGKGSAQCNGRREKTMETKKKLERGMVEGRERWQRGMIDGIGKERALD
jgi:hypothetical protein